MSDDPSSDGDAADIDAPDEFDGAVELDDDGDAQSTSFLSTPQFFIVLVVAALLLALGTVGYVSGIGWFGYRQWLYGSGDVYLGNYTPKERLVSVDGREAVELGPKKYEIVQLVGGTSTIRIMNTRGETLSTLSVTTDHSDAFVKVAGTPCLVAADITSFYGREDGALEFREFIKADQRVYVPDSYNVIWPGENFPDELDSGEGPGIWLEKVGCAHLEEPKMLRGYLQVRIRDRMNLEDQGLESPRR